MVHICSKRYENRTGKMTTVKVYSNCEDVKLYANGQQIAGKRKDKVFTFRVPMSNNVKLKAEASGCRDTALLHRVGKKDPAYKLRKSKKKSANWV